MNSVFLILFFVSIIALVVGVVKPSLLRQSSRLKAGLIFGGAAIMFFVLFGITSPATPAPVAATLPVKSGTVATTEQQPAAPQTLEQKIAAYAPQVYGGGMTFQNLEKDDTKSVIVTLDVSSILDADNFHRNTGLLASKIFQDVFAANPSAPMVSVLYAGEKTDTYGNTSTSTLMAYYMTKATFAKFNWPNFDGTTLCDVLRQAGNQDNIDTPNSDFLDGCAIFATNLQ